MKNQGNLGAVMVGIGSQFTAMIIAGFLLGWLTDRWLNTLPVFMLVFGVLGFVGGLIKAHKWLSRPR